MYLYTLAQEVSKVMNKLPIIVDVRGGVAYCDDERVKIVDHD